MMNQGGESGARREAVAGIDFLGGVFRDTDRRSGKGFVKEGISRSVTNDLVEAHSITIPRK